MIYIGFMIGIVTTFVVRWIFISSQIRYMKRPVLQDIPFYMFIDGLKNILYTEDCLDRQDLDRLEIIKSSRLLKKYRPTFKQAKLLSECFRRISTEKKVLKYINYPLLIDEHTLNCQKTYDELISFG